MSGTADFGFPLVDGDFPVWDENWPTFTAFLLVRTQWRSGFSGATGLDHTAVRGDLRELKIKNRKRIFAEILEMETAILAAWAEQDPRK